MLCLKTDVLAIQAIGRLVDDKTVWQNLLLGTLAGLLQKRPVNRGFLLQVQ